MIALSLPANTKHLAVALSGGPDSWALALLAHDWCQQNNAQLTALTVDHKLRADSTDEAIAVAAECAKRGIAHAVLTWQHDGISTGLQEAARTARYQLLTDYCRTHNIPLLLTAHHADDQSETVLMRFAKASDVGGLAGLAEASTMNGITLLRPLLHCTKQQLVDYATQAGVTFVTDPSNANEKFARVRLRNARAALEAEGLTTANIVRLSNKMRAADEALDFAMRHMIGAQLTVSPYGATSLPLAVIQNKPAALVQRALLHIWRTVTGNAGHPIGHDQLQALAQFNERKVTAAGMVLECDGRAMLAYREVAACASPITVAAHSKAVWDARFVIHNNTGAAVTVGALGEYGRERVQALGPAYAEIEKLNVAARAASPALHENATTRTPLLASKSMGNDVTALFLVTKSTDNTLYSAELNLSIV